MKTERDRQKSLLQAEQRRLEGEVEALRSKLAELADKAADFRQRRDGTAKALALGTTDEATFRKAHLAFAEAEARQAGTAAALAELEGRLGATSGEVDRIIAAEAEERRLAAIATATREAESAVDHVRRLFGKLSEVLAGGVFALRALEHLDARAAQRVSRGLGNGELLAGLLGSDRVTLGVTPSGETAAVTIPATIPRPAGIPTDSGVTTVWIEDPRLTEACETVAAPESVAV